MTDVEYRSEFAFWSLASSPLIFATDPRDLTPIMKVSWLCTHAAQSRLPGRCGCSVPRRYRPYVLGFVWTS